jgi:hypothetical protein
MTAVAIILWAVPEWRAYRYRREFEQSLTQLRIGTHRDVWELLEIPPGHKIGVELLNLGVGQLTYPMDRNRQQFLPLEHGKYWYVVKIRFEEIVTYTSPGPVAGSLERWTDVKVYRLVPAPREYCARTAFVRDNVASSENKGEPILNTRSQYLWDFYQFLSSDQREEFPGDWTLIHSDPPMAE